MKNIAKLHYDIRFSPYAHLIQVVLSIQNPRFTGEKLVLPTWIPGSYLIRELAKHVVSIEASLAQQLCPVQRIDKASWYVALGPKMATDTEAILEVRYQVYAFDTSVRTAYLDLERAFFNPSSVCLSVVGIENSAHTLTVYPPALQSAPWRVATTLNAADTVPNGALAAYRASSYAELIDHPILCGTFEALHFSVGQVPHQLVVSGHYHADLNRFSTDLQTLCEAHIALFNPNTDDRQPPFSRYTFLLHVVGEGEGYGGLEHGNCCALIANRTHLPALDEPTEPSAAYAQLLNLCSHEYFHAWNVKRIKPAAFSPYDLSQEAYTHQLWAFEGITSYYDELMLVRSGLLSTARYLEGLARQLTTAIATPGCTRQSLAEASFNAWIHYYRPDENTPNAHCNYYLQGACVALLLDLTLRRQTGKSLDDVMRALWEAYGRDTGARSPVGLTAESWQLICQQVAGFPLGDFFDQYVNRPADVVTPLLASLSIFGIVSQRRHALNSSDQGGAVLSTLPAPTKRLGIRAAAHPAGVRLNAVLTGSIAEQAGLSGGDILIAVDGVRVDVDQLAPLISRMPDHSRIPLHAFRGDRLLMLNATLYPEAPDTIGLAIDATADEKATSLRESWLPSTRKSA